MNGISRKSYLLKLLSKQFDQCLVEQKYEKICVFANEIFQSRRLTIDIYVIRQCSFGWDNTHFGTDSS